MTIKRTDSSVWMVLLWAVLAVCCGNVLAATASCQYPKPGVQKNGSGIGGTGAVAKGSGIGGTGLHPDADPKLLQIAGNVTEIRGTVEASQNGKKRRLAKNDAVCVGETLATSGSGAAQIRMADGGLIGIRSRSKLKIEAFNFGGLGKMNSRISLIEGTARFVTGKIGKDYPQNVIVTTPTAVIGVHGTDHEATVILIGGNAGDPAGTYDKVTLGVTFIRTEAGEIDVRPDQVGFASGVAEPPILLDEAPGFLHADHAVMPGVSLPEEKHPPTDIGDTPQHDEFAGHEVGDAEHPDLMDSVPSILEGHDIGDIPHLPEIDGHPDLPELPELPEAQEMPGTHDD